MTGNDANQRHRLPGLHCMNPRCWPRSISWRNYLIWAWLQAETPCIDVARRLPKASMRASSPTSTDLTDKAGRHHYHRQYGCAERTTTALFRCWHGKLPGLVVPASRCLDIVAAIDEWPNYNVSVDTSKMPSAALPQPCFIVRQMCDQPRCCMTDSSIFASSGCAPTQPLRLDSVQRRTRQRTAVQRTEPTTPVTCGHLSIVPGQHSPRPGRMNGAAGRRPASDRVHRGERRRPRATVRRGTPDG